MSTRPHHHSASAYPPRSGLFIAQLPVNGHGRQVINKVLIANRGEIACRIIATCRKLGIISVAVYVNEDGFSRHIGDSDEAVNIGSVEDSTMGNPFLNIDLLISTAVSVGAQAIHPGYGYLSENASFAQAVRDAGLIFIGPSAKAMSTLGDKRSSKDYLREHCPSVPLIPGCADLGEDIERLEIEAENMDYPVMIKASAGGGGKGMRVVHNANNFRDELGRAQSEAQRSFGSSDCILEKYIQAAKHIEVQILGDRYGNVLSLWERECSIQRRHQKIIEETPCPWITQEKREEMCDVAVKIGKLLAYEGAGTVEFVFDVATSHFFFLEVNTRLQVEHPITEEVTNLDIVSLQLYVAAGGNLTSLSALANISRNGHAIECRLCAEDPHNSFYPQHGIVRFWKPAEQADNVRYETAIRTSASVSIHFDSLIAKIVVWAPTRSLAIEKMRRVLSNTACLGLRTNLHFLQSCLVHDAFQDPKYTTSFILENLSSLLETADPSNPQWPIQKMPLIPFVFLQRLERQANRPFRNVWYGFRNQRHDPMVGTTLIINSQDPVHKYGPLICISKPTRDTQAQEIQLSSLSIALQSSDQDHSSKTSSATSKLSHVYNTISNGLRNGSYIPESSLSQVFLEHCEIDTIDPHKDSKIISPWVVAKLKLSIDGQKLQAYISSNDTQVAGPNSMQIGRGQHFFVYLPVIGTQVEYECFNLLSYCESLREEMELLEEDEVRTVRAPMPCKVLSVSKRSGDKINQGESVMVVESMKMEINISVAVKGMLDIKVKQGDAVNEGSVLCTVYPEE